MITFVSSINTWISNKQGSRYCQVCKKELIILKRHYWTGLPKYCNECKHKAGNYSRWEKIRNNNLFLISDVAHKLNVSVQTIHRYSEKYLNIKKYNNTKVFNRDDIDTLKDILDEYFQFKKSRNYK